MANTKTGQAHQAVDQQGQYRFRQLLAQGGREGGLIALIVLCLYLVMALVSHNPADPGWASIGHQTEATNYAGRSGAWIASLLITFFGKLAWLFPVLGAGAPFSCTASVAAIRISTGRCSCFEAVALSCC